MSETMTQLTELSSQYSAQVASDLERNLKEQECISNDIEALHTRLTALRHDHTVLMNVQQALGIPAQSAGVPPAEKSRPRKKQAAETGTRAKSKRTSDKASQQPASKDTSEAPATTRLIDLVRTHLADQSEPRSAAEIATALGQQQPDRTIKTTVVRNALEGLVAKNRAQRTKQGRSVYYSAVDTIESAALGEQDAEVSA